MAFVVKGSVNENFSAVTENYPAISQTINAGALIKKVAGTATVEVIGADTAAPILGVTTHAITSSTSGSVDVSYVPNGTILEADVTEIIDGTTLTATAGGTDSFTDASLKVTPDDFFIGAVFEVVTMASGDKAAGTRLTCTDSTASSGKIEFADLGATGFANTDTVKLISLDNDRVSGKINAETDGSAYDEISIVNSAGSAGDLFRIIGTNNDGTKLRVVVTAGLDNSTALSTS